MKTIAPHLQDAIVTVASPTHASEVLVELAKYQQDLLQMRCVPNAERRFFVEEAFNDIVMIVDGDERPWIIDSMNWHYSWIPRSGVNVYLEVFLSLERPRVAGAADGATYNRHLCVRYWPTNGEFEPIQAVVEATSDSEPERSEIYEMLSG